MHTHQGSIFPLEWHRNGAESYALRTTIDAVASRLTDVAARWDNDSFRALHDRFAALASGALESEIG